MNKWKPHKTLVIRIAVSAVVVLLVGGVFFMKKSQNSASTSAPAPAASQTADKPNPPSIAAKPSAVAGVSGDLHVTAPIDYGALRSSGLPVIIDFGADSCVPCKEMAPVLAELNKSLQGKAVIRFVDVWKYKGLADGVPLQVIPTQVFFDSQGKPFDPPESLRIKFIKYSRKDTNEHVFTTHEGGLDKAQMMAILNAMGMK